MLTPSVVGSDLWGFFRVRQIATNIKGAVTVDPGESPVLAHRRLRDQRFDQAPVVAEDRVLGWVKMTELSSGQAIASVMTPLHICPIVSADASIADVLQILAWQDLIFTADKDGLSGFIVRSDLDRHAVRSYFYLLISGVEMLLSELVRSAISEERAVSFIRAGLKDTYESARSENEETNAVEYLFINHLVDLFCETPFVSDTRIWDEALTNQLLSVRDFRNNVMHPTRSIAATTHPREAAHIARCAEEVSGRLRNIVTMLHSDESPQ